jgi:uncharacterized protein (TIGR02099 family)
MRNFLRRLLKFAAYAAAGFVILLAVAVGLFRLFLPRLPEHQEEIKGWASTAIGMQVEFTGMDARWGLSGPELKFYGAELMRPGSETRLIAAAEVGVGVSLVRLMIDRTLVVDRVTVSDTSIELRQLENGSWQVQGADPRDFLSSSAADAGAIGSVDVIGVDVELQLIRHGDERPTFFDVSRVQVRRDDLRISLDANIQLPEEIGGQIDLSAIQVLAGDERSWNVSVEIDDIDVAGTSDLVHDEKYRLGSGQGNLDLALAYANERVVSATASVDLENLAFGDGPAFDISGRFDVSNDIDGWLLAADELLMSTPAGDWPRSSLRVETSTDHTGKIVMLDARASYLNLSDYELFMDWLDADRRQFFDQLQPDGIVRNAAATLSDADTDEPRYSVTATLDKVGYAARGNIPGLRGFSGNLRADHSSGLLEIESDSIELSLPAWLNQPVDINTASGTVIWRRSGQRTTILSDSISIRNTFLNSDSDIEIILDGDASPVIDLASNWSINDISVAKRYIPEAILKPKLYTWFQDALVSGELRRGRTRFYGSLDDFPFDNGEGHMLIEATVRNTHLQYLPQFPAAEISELDVVLENARLFTDSNRSINRGNAIVNAVVEIPDLRQPVLNIAAFSTGTLETIRDFSANSPIGSVFGGQLDRVSVSGDASFTLDLLVPLLDWKSFEFTARVLSSNGSIAIEGLNPPISDLSGAVTIERDLISSESLGGQFMGEPVTIDLMNAPPEATEYRVVAHATGAATAARLIEDLGVPLAGRLDGRADYTVDIFFPRAGIEAPAPVSVKVQSDLLGMNLDMPLPFRKPAAESRGFSGELNFMPGGQRIESRGTTDGEFSWDIAFVRESDAWDFDRGMLVLGDAPMSEPDVRGLHVRGHAGEFKLEDWLELSKHDDVQIGAAERIRSIELDIDDLYLLGQHLREHHVRVDRSARDWLVQVEGEKVSGSVFVPYDFTADRALVLDMERLILPGDDTVTEGAATPEKPPTDPRKLPAISVKAAEFGIGERMFGTLEAEITRTPEGLVTDSIIAQDPTFGVVSSGQWVVDADDPTGFRSSMTASLTSNDVVRTMARLNYQPGIVSNDMGMLIDISWSGGPRMDFLDSLDGEAQVRLGIGSLVEVEPGAGRVFGLMSIVALPRRLSLDFRDVFQKGFGFDKIEGSFRLEDGTAYTCNLLLEGPAAGIAIVGRSNLVERSYDQTAVVTTNLGNTLPLVGVVVAGPQVAAALLLFSQIFKKPLQDMSRVYYSVSGSYDEPTVESSDVVAFGASGQLANCVD